MNRQLPDAAELPPHSLDAERGMLGCALLDGLVAGELDPAWFYDLRHREIAELLRDASGDGRPMDTPMFLREAIRLGKADAWGGSAYLTTLEDQAPTAGNADYWKPVLEEMRERRSMLRLCAESKLRAQDTASDWLETVAGFESAAMSVRHMAVNEECDLRETLRLLVEQIEAAHRGEVKVGLPTGFPDFDRLVGGLRKSEMVVVAARPGVGKTTLGMNMAEHLAVDSKVPVGFISLEMNPEQLVKRLLCSRARIDSDRIESAVLSEGDFARMELAVQTLRGAPVHIIRGSGMTIHQVRSSARRLVKLRGCECVMVDYLQLIVGSHRTDNRQTEIAAISRGIAEMAKELELPVLVLCQLNREAEREKRYPRLSDLRESGAIEQDADVVAILANRIVEDEDEAGDDAAMVVQCDVAKNRNGRTGRFWLTFLRNLTRFESTAKVDRDDVP